MANMSPNRTPMSTQDPQVRAGNFNEVALGYTFEMAQEEASRCLLCKNSPCVTGCPVNVQIPDFIRKLNDGDIQGAYDTIYNTNSLPAVCGRVCPQERQCESKCTRGIKAEPVAIGRLERFVADWAREHGDKTIEVPVPNGKRVAVVGSGPAGLTCASDLAKLGYHVAVFEALHTAGGVLAYGIPEFRLPKAIVADEVNKLEQLGVEFHTNTVIGRTLTVDELFADGYSAVFIGSGAGLPIFMGIPGEMLAGVYAANEYLTRINLMKAYQDGYDTPIKHSRSVAVVGGGNVTMDSVRCARRMGAEHVYVVYRREEADMPARLEEIHHAKEEGVEFLFTTAPTRILDDGKGHVAGMECVKTVLGEPDESGRRSPINVPGTEFILDVDTVIMSLGTNPNPLIRQTTEGLDTNRKGCILVEPETMATSKPMVYAGGDVATGAASVILAMGAGKKAAAAIHEALTAKN